MTLKVKLDFNRMPTIEEYGPYAVGLKIGEMLAIKSKSKKKQTKPQHHDTETKC